MGYIYSFRNKINNKYYIGQTTRKPEIRYKTHLYQLYDGTVFHRAILKYGIENFEFNVIGEFPDEKLNEMEEYYIRQYNSHWRDGYGYNMSYGGENSPDVMRKPVRAYPLDDNLEPIYEQGQYFKSMSEACEKLTELTGNTFYIPYIVKICKGQRYSVFNYTFCYVDIDTGQDIPTNYTGFKGSQEASRHNIKKCHEKNSMPVIMYSPTGEVYEFKSRSEAEKALHIGSMTIDKLCKTGREILGGKNKGWRAKYKEDF